MLSEIAFYGALETGLIYGLVAFGIYLSFRVLDFPDLTVDGSFPLGAAVAAMLIIEGWNPWLATGCAVLAGMAAGAVTAILNVKLNILNLLASILTMIALYSVNLRIMGRPNVALLTEETVLSPWYDLGLAFHQVPVLLFTLVAIVHNLGFLAINFAFSLGDVSQVYPINASSPLLTFAMSYFILHNDERLSIVDLVGIVAVVAGVGMLFA